MSTRRCYAEEHRELARQQLLLLLKAGYSPLRFYVHDIRKYFYLGELLALVDLSLVCFSSEQPAVPINTRPRLMSPGNSSTNTMYAQTVKMGVQYSLWGGSILNLGTEKHRKAYFEDIDKFRLPGAFCVVPT